MKQCTETGVPLTTWSWPRWRRLEALIFDCRDDAMTALADGFAPQRVARMPLNSLRLPQCVPPQRRIGDCAAKRRAESTRPTAASFFGKARLIRAMGVIFLAAVLTSCGGSGGDGSQVAPTGTATIGPAGGSVAEASGAQVVVPAGALATETQIGVARSSTGAPALPAGVTPVGPIYAFTPHGIAFSSPATITVPFDASQVPAGATLALFKTDATLSAWKQIPAATAVGSSMSGPVNGFSFAVVAMLPPTQLLAVRKDWGIAAARDCCAEPEIQDLHSSPDDGEYGSNAETFPFGAPLALIPGTPRADMRAQGSVVFTQDGHTYWASAEAPKPSDQDPPDLHMGISALNLLYTFRKNSPDAKLQFVLTAAQLDAIDGGGNREFQKICPWVPVGATPEVVRERCDRFALAADLTYGLMAWSVSNGVFYTVGAGATMAGIDRVWEFDTSIVDVESLRPFAASTPDLPDYQVFDRVWNDSDFVFDQDVDRSGGRQARARLRKPITINVPLGDVPTDSVFNVEAIAATIAANELPGETYAAAYLRDPLLAQGMEVQFTGLEVMPSQRLPITAKSLHPCGNAPDPAAGQVRFTAANFFAPERQPAIGRVEIERTGGNRGEIGVMFETRDGTAVGGSDYKSVRKVVWFRDGDDGKRTVFVPIVLDTVAGPDKTVNLVLTMVSGCASLGAQSTATFTIMDDDRPPAPPPPPSSPGTLDTSYGDQGKASAPGFGGNGSKMALQADGKAVIVGGTATQFVLARFNADGTLDASFGNGGKVTTDVAAGRQQQARAVAIQRDGKIVVVGEGVLPTIATAVALVRYNADGSLDTSFGVGGKVFDGVLLGRAFAVAIQPDGKIVVGGDGPTASNTNFGAFLVARFNVDGSRDPSFGTDGFMLTTISGNDLVRNIVLQPNGAIVAAGDPISSSSAGTGVARYTASGSLDTSFGQGGVLLLRGAQVGLGLALQSDGKLLLAGTSGAFRAQQFALMRLNADGRADASFGNAGLVTTTMGGPVEIAHAVALRADGRILVAGESGDVGSDFALARYNIDGALDTSFASGGTLVFDFFNGDDRAESVAVQADGKIVLGGSARASSTGYALARINP